MHVDLRSLAKSVEDFSKSNGFETRTNYDQRTPPTWFQIQSMKSGLGRTIVGARRCLTTVIRGDPDDFEVTIGTSDWGKNLTAALITGSLTLGIGFLWAGASAATYKMFEEKLTSYINDEVLRLSNTGVAVPSLNGQMAAGPYAKETKTGVRTPTPWKLHGTMGVIVIALLLVIVLLLAGLLVYLFSHTFTPLNMRQIPTFMKTAYQEWELRWDRSISMRYGSSTTL